MDADAVNRILLTADEVAAGGRVLLRGSRAEHVLTVLRVGPGDLLRVGLLDGPVGEGRVCRVSEAEVVLDCVFAPDAPEREPLDLLLALPRPKVLRRLLPQLAALGVRHIFLSNAWRVEKSYFSTHRLDGDRLREGLVEGLQQAGATRLPGISVHRHLRRLIEDELDDALPPHTARLRAAPGAGLRLGRWLPASQESRALVAVGPEGGWIEPEEALLRAHGFRDVSLGSRILRSDTACIALLAVLRERLDAVRA